jgi:hypothetical protein
MGSFVLIAALAVFVAGTYQAIRSLGPRRGVVAALVGGWLFLPVFDGHLAVPLLAGKMAFIPTVILIISAALDPRLYSRIRTHWVDLVAAVMWFSPFVTALANDLGPYEGLSASVASFTAWGTPYLLGRAYLGTPGGARDFAVGLVIGALVYVPFCLWEIRMSPQLHRQIYGYATFENFAFAVRFGGYRPTVFMQFGLMVGTFMASGSVACYWLWRTRALRALRGIPLGWWTLLLVATTVLVKSTGAVILMAVGIGLLELTRLLERRLPLVILAVLPLVFAGARVAGWSGHEIAQLASLINTEREQSVAFRLQQEERLVEKAMQRPALGWGRFGRSRVYDEDGNDVSVTDSLWVIVLGTSGIVGLSALGLAFVLPTLLLLRRHPARRWRRPELAPAAAIAVVTVLWVIDCLLNAMTGPLFPAMCGSTISFVGARWSQRPRAVPGRTPREPQGPPELRVS